MLIWFQELVKYQQQKYKARTFIIKTPHTHQQFCHRQAVFIVTVATLLLRVRGLIYAKPLSRTDVL